MAKLRTYHHPQTPAHQKMPCTLRNSGNPVLSSHNEGPIRVEDAKRYEKGGYHPVHLHDELHDGRYKILHKLGFGISSTVWLAHDTQ